MNPEKLDAELNKLWAKVAGPKDTVEPEAAWLPSLPEAGGMPSSRGAAVEALQLVKRQHRELQARWEAAMEMKESAVAELSESLRRAEAEIAELRRRSQRFEARLVEEVSGLAQKLEAAHGLLRQEQEQASLEESRLVDALARLDAENRELKDREGELRSALEGANARSAGFQGGKEAFEKDSRMLGAAVRQARETLAETLSELLSERRAREKAEDEAQRLRRDFSELADRTARMEKLWDEERRQWDVLLERERSKAAS